MAVWDPFQELEALREEIDRAFDSAGRSSRSRRQAFLPGLGARLYPLLNLYDDGNNLYVEALAPGLDQDKLEVTAVGNSLTIAGEKPGLSGVPPQRIHRNERAAGRFVRTIELSIEVDPAKGNAQYKNGILRLTLPRAESARPRRIAVQAD